MAESRALTDDERSLLAFMLSDPIEEREALLAQAATATTTGSSCDCGCPSFTLQVDLSVARVDLCGVVRNGEGVDAGSNAVGVILWADDGYLSEVEVHALGGSFDGLPRPADLTLYPNVTDGDQDGVTGGGAGG